MGYLLHRRVELSEERGSVSGLTFDYCTSRALETRDPHISHAMWGVQDHPAGCCSAVGVASGWGASDRIIKFEELPPDADIVSIQRYARAYIMQLIGGFIFADKSNTLVYCMFSQFLFDFDQILHCSSTENAAAFRWSTFEFQVNWTPYTPDIMASLPARCHMVKWFGLVWVY
ncbi:serine/threonine-protein phosphatase 7 long form-like protein [Cucumis melo var. makuwa]|uniref:Serine/threonine-protein phosphatase 7 long form-like protein n=1 Tax=Cucumis melo var. makuwa TaxID=1194695 RepID=A0A5A7TP39_CUCMM|nr:serine/threonine-protein phosphatase 7 long form-like protein [Cucumis melo var. makuwa]